MLGSINNFKPYLIKKTMKKNVLIIAAVVCVMALGSCEENIDLDGLVQDKEVGSQMEPGEEDEDEPGA